MGFGVFLRIKCYIQCYTNPHVALMGTIIPRRNKSGVLRHTAQIRQKHDGAVVHNESATFGSVAAAKEWLRRRETELDSQRARGEPLGSRMTVEQMITWYQGLEDKTTPWGRTKRAEVARLKAGPLADKRVDRLTTPDFIDYTRKRREEGAGPATASNDLIWFRQVFRAAATELRAPVPTHALDDAADYLRRNRIIGKPKRRDRRLLPGEEAALLAHFAVRDVRAFIPMQDIVAFALATARRQDEITQLRWDDLDRDKGVWLLRDVKHPTHKQGNHRTFRILPGAIAIADRQPRIPLPDGTLDPRVFPFDAKSVGAAFTRAVPLLGMQDLHFHDLRHEATSRLFEMGYDIPQVAQFTLHESWATLKRYTHLRPEQVPDKSGS